MYKKILVVRKNFLLKILMIMHVKLKNVKEKIQKTKLLQLKNVLMIKLMKMHVKLKNAQKMM